MSTMDRDNIKLKVGGMPSLSSLPNHLKNGKRDGAEVE